MPVYADFATVIRQKVLDGMPGPRHPFRRKVLEGRATRADLAVFAVQTYHRNLYSSRFASANHSRCPDPEIRRGLLKVASEEELSADGGPPSHAELMLRFATALGMERDDVVNARPLPSTLTFIDTIMQLSQGHWLEGMAFRASELGVPRSAARWHELLQKHYGLTPDAVQWWSAHAVDDVEHGNIALDAYGRWARDESEQALSLRAIDRMLAAWWVFFDGIERGAEAALRGEDVGFPVPAAASWPTPAHG
ncbi:MAG TPA: iron-containing redox enzyme family protein [Chloroflexota bacterium]|nr:iron-containing redox enzyme family protein [Chloroflexota bacterium]